MKVISLRVSDQLDARLRAIARRSRVGRSAVIRRVLEHVTDRPGADPSSFLEQAQDLVGRLAGPSDLSSNKARLRRYGR
ncbi:MAG: ribbon-helix-helix protein, CopG family [Vicinamibacteria bacterium]